MSEEKAIFLNVNPFIEDHQLIHMETIPLLGSIAFTAKFNCVQTKKEKKIKVNSITFEMYKMTGIVHFGFKKIEVIKKPIDGKRIIKIELGINNTENKITPKLPSSGIYWESKDIIDNQIKFNIFGKKMEREDLIKHLEKLNAGLEKNIPINGRPCQFKLVKEME